MYAPVWARVSLPDESTRHQTAVDDVLPGGVCVIWHDNVWIIEADSEGISYPDGVLACVGSSRNRNTPSNHAVYVPSSQAVAS